MPKTPTTRRDSRPPKSDRYCIERHRYIISNTSPALLLAQLHEYRIDQDLSWRELEQRVESVIGRPASWETLRIAFKRGSANARTLRKIQDFLQRVASHAS